MSLALARHAPPVRLRRERMQARDEQLLRCETFQVPDPVYASAYSPFEKKASPSPPRTQGEEGRTDGTLRSPANAPKRRQLLPHPRQRVYRAMETWASFEACRCLDKVRDLCLLGFPAAKRSDDEA